LCYKWPINRLSLRQKRHKWHLEDCYRSDCRQSGRRHQRDLPPHHTIPLSRAFLKRYKLPEKIERQRDQLSQLPGGPIFLLGLLVPIQRKQHPFGSLEYEDGVPPVFLLLAPCPSVPSLEFH